MSTLGRSVGVRPEDLRPSYGSRPISAMRLKTGLPCLNGPTAPQYPFDMANEIPSVGDLRRKAEITDAEIDAAVDAYLKDEGAEPFVFGSGHRVDVAKAIEMHPQAAKLLADEATTLGLRRTMIRTAVVMGFPVAK